jgi:hypothetical protein
MHQTVQHGEGSEAFGRASPNRVQDRKTAFSALGTYAPRAPAATQSGLTTNQL